MIIITIKPLKAELTDFDIKEGTAEIAILFRDNADEHRLAIKRKIENSEELAEQMVMEMRRIVKKSHTPERDDYAEILAIRVDDEEGAVKKLRLFFDKVNEKIKEVKKIKSAKGYLDTLTRAKKLEMQL